MKTITINIVKKSVMGVVEGLSATIAKHNPEVDFETVWASDAEEAKLDIYYREAITDLENFLAQFSSSTTQQFDLQALADDFTITIKTLAYWPTRLSGVLTNQVQNYLVHALMAGWLSDFPEIPHTDYASMGASDLEVIKEILLKKEFSFAEAARHKDEKTKDKSSATDTCTRVADNKNQDACSINAEARGTDAEKEREVCTSSVRVADDAIKEEDSTNTFAKTADGADKQQNKITSKSRTSDTDTREQMSINPTSRQQDSTRKEASSGANQARNEDNATQCFDDEYVDWSGGMPPYELS